MYSRDLLLAITGNQALTERILERRGHTSHVASEPRIQFYRGKEIERHVNLLGNTIAVPEPEDYRDVLEASAITHLVATPSGEPLRVPVEAWDAWMVGMETERQERAAELEEARRAKLIAPCAVGDRIYVITGGCRIEGRCVSVGKKYIRYSPLQTPASVVTAPFRLVTAAIHDGNSLHLGTLRCKRRRDRRKKSRAKNGEAITSGT